MDIVWQEISAELGDVTSLVRVALRLLLAVVIGSFVGLQREHANQAAGWRTHTLVALAAAMFVMAVRESGGTSADVSRVIQGVATGIGFVGAGAIIKLTEKGKVQGLTTAASVWLSAGIGIAVGVGRIWLPLAGAVIGWTTLVVLRAIEQHFEGPQPDHDV